MPATRLATPMPTSLRRCACCVSRSSASGSAVAEAAAQPLVSVVVPVFAGERFVGDALDSVAVQTYPHVETIVVDDGSPDRSVEVASSRSGVRVLRERHRGVAAARNAGLAAARGELVAFLDQDDLWRPSKLALQVALLSEHRD